MINELAIIKSGEFTADTTLALASDLYRENRLADAREILLPEIATRSGLQLLESVLLLSKVEGKAGRYDEALRLLADFHELFSTSPMLARFHTMLAALYLDIFRRDPSARNSDRALIEYEAASFEWEQSNDATDAGCAENNIGLLLGELGKPEEAREHLRRARALFAGLPVKLAQVDETEAQICLKEGRPEAYGLALKACQTFYEYDEQRLLLEATRTLQLAAAAYVHEAARSA